MRKCTILISVLLCFVLVFSGCGKGAQETSAIVPKTDQPSQTEPEKAVIIEQPAPAIEGDICPLTGMTVEKELVSQRPFAVMIDNMASARPQSGLINADIVYEMPAEGGITRYMAIFHHQSSDKIGPVRSARSYFIDKAMEFNAVYIHCGGSDEAKADIDKLKIDSLDELKGATNFWRARDRKAPHNLYTSTKLAREVMQSKKLDGEKWSYGFNFSKDFLQPGGKKVSKFTINYQSGYKVGYEYDEKTKLFYRNVNGVRLKDKETGQEVTTVNVIIEKVNSKIVDKIGHLDLENTGTGRGYLVTGGELIELQWAKADRQAKTVYTDLKGNPIQLNKGNTWIQVIPEYATTDFKE